MPHCERVCSPEEPISEHYFISRLELDLYELVEEQQILLGIISREQEHLERHLPELLHMQLDEISHEPQPQITVVPEVEANLSPRDEALVEQLELLNYSKMAPVLQPTTPSVEPPIHRPIRVVSRQDFKGAKCTPPKRHGLGYDTGFPYPKHLGRSRERRALYIFTLCEGLVQQLQRQMNLHASGELCSCHGVDAPTGALPKSKFKRLEKSAKRVHKPLAVKHKQKTPLKASSLLEPEIDLDCEFGMEHIEKFRYNCVREDQGNLFHSTLLANEPIFSDNSLIPSGRTNVLFGVKLPEPSIGEDNSPQTQQLALPDWYENGTITRSLGENLPCTPEKETLPLQPASLLSSECINLMPSTSAQARAMSLAMVSDQHSASSQSTALPSLDSLHSHSSDHIRVMANNQFPLDAYEEKMFFSYEPVNDNEFNAACWLPCEDAMCSTEIVPGLSPLPPAPPPPSPVLNPVAYDTALPWNKENGINPLTPMGLHDDDINDQNRR